MTILFAWLIDLTLGEPPAHFHPVVWMGRYPRAARKRLPSTLLAGALAWLGGALLVFTTTMLLVWLFNTIVNRLPLAPNLQSLISSLLFAIVLKPLFAWRALREAGQAVLAAPDLP